jgi:predicted ATPase
MNPGHVHYYVRFVDDLNRPSPETCAAERDANFAVFNLVTLFLDQNQLASLGRLLSATQEELTDIADQKTRRADYCFYISGVPGSGKTTTTSYLRNLITYDEWLEERPANLAKPHAQLTDAERLAVDQWVMDQIHVKNNAIEFDSRRNPIGIRFVDRSLLDPVVFSKNDQWPDKAAAIKRTIARGKSERKVHPGHVILLIGDPREMAVRVKSQNKDSNQDYTSSLQRAMQQLYVGPGVTHVDVRGNNIHEVVKKVSRIVHLDEYEECDLQGLLDRVEVGEIEPPPGTVDG